MTKQMVVIINASAGSGCTDAWADQMIFKPYQPIPRPIIHCACCVGAKNVVARRIKPLQQPKTSVDPARGGGAQQGLCM